MYPAEIDAYTRPGSIAEALDTAAGYAEGEALFLAGGQSLMQAIKSRLVRPRCLIDLQAVGELQGIRHAGDVTLGAMTRYARLAADEDLGPAHAALRDAAQHVGDRQVRNRGTIGGSVCWNYAAACMPTVMLALGAVMNLVAAGGTRRAVGADEFLLGPFETARRADEILQSITVPAALPRSGSAYRKWGLVKDALPVIGVSALVSLDTAGRCTTARISVTGLSDGSRRVAAGDGLLVGSAGEEPAIDAALAAVAAVVAAPSDQWADADYRRQLIRRLGREVLVTAFARART